MTMFGHLPVPPPPSPAAENWLEEMDQWDREVARIGRTEAWITGTAVAFIVVSIAAGIGMLATINLLIP